MKSINNKPKTIICDIDGVLLEHRNQGLSSQLYSSPLENTIDKLTEWDSKGYNIILITGRRESLRKSTEKQLTNSERNTAHAINLYRNEGIKNVEI